MKLSLLIWKSQQRLRKALWIKACRYESIDHTEKFVIFSDDNPHIKRLNELGR